MDGSFGTIWTGERIDKTDGLLSNGLFDKLLNFPDFKNGVKERWQELRLTVLEIGNVNQLFFDNENYLATNAIYEREALVPEITQNYSDLEVEYIESWIERRTTFLDEYFNGL